ncbi:MAG: zinc ribbon domain-containing protein [Desulfobacterales bacterium]|nr:zinc ribbon domain-containing protein [Desulfobacterales bacterium]
MFFFIGGITPKTRRIDEQPIRCPNCGLNQAYRTRVDHWLHLFFIPVFPVKRGEPFLFCEHCRRPVDSARTSAPPPRSIRLECRVCGKPVEEGFRYCPHCGQRLS